MFLNDITDIHPSYHLRPIFRPLFKYYIVHVDHVFVKSNTPYILPDLTYMKKVTLTKNLFVISLKSLLKNTLMNVVFWYVTHEVEHHY